MNSPVKRLARRLILPAAMLACLTALGLPVHKAGAESAAAEQIAVIPCCSACESENPPPGCRFGCSPSCRTSK